MATKPYIGVRVEVSCRIVPNTKTLKKACKNAKISDICSEGRITVEKSDSMLIARGKKDEKSKGSGLINFSIMQPLDAKGDAERVVRIVNVLGNDRLIRERVLTFMTGLSILNEIPELQGLKMAFKELEKIAPGFINAGWYYAPEAKLM